MAITWALAPNFTGLPSKVVGQLRGGVPGGADYEASIGVGTGGGDLTQTGDLLWTNGGLVPFSFTFDPIPNRVRLTVGAVTVAHVHPTPLTPERIFLLAVTRSGTQVTRWVDLTVTAAGTGETAHPPDLVCTGSATAAMLISGWFRGGVTLSGRFGFSWVGAMPLRSNLLAMVKLVDEDQAWIPDDARPPVRDPSRAAFLAALDLVGAVDSEPNPSPATPDGLRRSPARAGRGQDRDRRRTLGLPEAFP
ncbi:MAG: hypothetical protein RLZZ127_3140 [Planctomycetota bacterium]|jgi:hypothetical protein